MMTGWSTTDKRWFWAYVFVALLSIGLVLSGVPQFLGLAFLEIVLAVVRVMGATRRATSADDLSIEEQVETLLPWALALLVLVVVVGVVRGVLSLNDDPGSAVVYFCTSVVAVVLLGHYLFGVHRLRSAPPGDSSDPAEGDI